MTAALSKARTVSEDMQSLRLMEDEDAGHQKWAPNLIWREKVVQWSYDVADHLKEERSVVYVAVNILDRYCAKRASESIKMDEKAYEIASLSSVFLAVRIAGSGNLLISELVAMSRGGITAQDIIATGTDIVKKLSWEYKILTPMDFVKSFLRLVPVAPQNVLDSASYLTEIAVCDVVLSHSKASFLAIAACLNVLRSDLPSRVVAAFIKAVRDTTAIDAECSEIEASCARLADVYGRSGGGNRPQQGQAINDDEADCGPHLIEDYDDDEDEGAVAPEISKRIYCIDEDEDDDDPQDKKRTKFEF